MIRALPLLDSSNLEIQLAQRDESGLDDQSG